MKNKINLFLVHMLSRLLIKLTPKAGLPKSWGQHTRGCIDIKIGDEVFYIGDHSVEKPPRFVKVLDTIESANFSNNFGVVIKEINGDIKSYGVSWFWTKSQIDKINKIHAKKHLSKADVVKIVRVPSGISISAGRDIKMGDVNISAGPNAHIRKG